MKPKVKAATFITTLIFALLWAVSIFAEGKPKILIEYFFQPGCPECELVKTFILPQLKEKFNGKYQIKNFDINKPENIPTLVEYQEKFKIIKDEPVSMVVNQRAFINGYKAMKAGLFDCIEKQLSAKNEQQLVNKVQGKSSDDKVVLKHFESFTPWAVSLAGLLDGINPCVFATLIFFISLLSVSKITGRKLLLAGSVYCMACFISYLALGFGLFRFLKLFTGYKQIQLGVNIAMAAILVVLALLSFRDAWRFKKTGKAESIDLQLPRRLKLAIHTVMRKGLHYRHLIPGAFIIGVLVTAIESVCTGQVYVPTLVFLTKVGNFQATLFLIIYNLAFIIPLLVLFALAYKGATTVQLINWSRKNIVPSKILMGCLFVLLAVLIIIL